MNPILTKNFTTGGAVTKRRLVKFSADATVVQAAAATDLIIGAVAELDAESGGRCDVHVMGIADVESGGTISRGALVTADSNGKAVAAAPAAGVNNRVAGIAMVAASSGDIFPVLLMPHQIQGA